MVKVVRFSTWKPAYFQEIDALFTGVSLRAAFMQAFGGTMGASNRQRLRDRPAGHVRPVFAQPVVQPLLLTDNSRLSPPGVLSIPGPGPVTPPSTVGTSPVPHAPSADELVDLAGLARQG